MIFLRMSFRSRSNEDRRARLARTAQFPHGRFARRTELDDGSLPYAAGSENEVAIELDGELG
jgi:hypothetical protein